MPLDRHGNAIGSIWSIEKGKRIVNVHPGEKILHNGTAYTVKAVEVFRSLPLAT